MIAAALRAGAYSYASPGDRLLPAFSTTPHISIPDSNISGYATALSQITCNQY
ncbi:MAG: hypothetical protein NT117_10950 [Gammaproteobacteria bacterium]|nr:hypothetical protein [Gammaproteobacteria bacterium]